MLGHPARIELVERGLALLPSKMRSANARVQLYTTGFQESKFKHRKQQPGPAVSFFQFERIGIQEVLQNIRTKRFALDACENFGVDPTVSAVYASFKETRGDELSVIFSRLNYWKESDPMPAIGKVSDAYHFYDKTWKPGKKRPQDWQESYNEALITLNRE